MEAIIVIMFVLVLLLVGASFCCALCVLIECFKYFKKN